MKLAVYCALAYLVMAVPIQTEQCCQPTVDCSKMNASCHDTIEAVKTLKALGGIDGCLLDKLDLEPKKCVCYGTPIGDRLLSISGRLA